MNPIKEGRKNKQTFIKEEIQITKRNKNIAYVTNHKGDASRNNNELSSHATKNGTHQKVHKTNKQKT